MRLHAIALATISTALAACATSYQPTGFTGGFEETFLAPDVVRVKFSGNAYTSGTRAQDFAMLRAAEVMLEAGYPYFLVVGEDNATQVSTYTTPGHSTTQGTANTTGTYSANPYGNTGTYSGSTSYRSTTTYNPGQTMVFYKPQSGLLIKGFSQQPEGVGVFDARFIAKSIKSKYKIE